MICQSCKKEVDNDLVFCTECGSRLHETISSIQTVILPDSVVTKSTEIIEKPKSKFKLVGTIFGLLALIGIPAAIIFYFVLKSPNKIASNKTNINSSTPSTRKSLNQNKNTNLAINNSNLVINRPENSNTNSNYSNENVSLKQSEKKVLEETVTIDADSTVAYPFKVLEDNVKIVGKVEIIQGEQFDGYVFLQDVYDDGGVDPNKKVYSFDTDETEQYLPKGNYVLILANNDGQGASLKVKFSQIPQKTAN